MTREEANELKAAVGRLMYSDNKDIRDYNVLIDFIESALRPVSREKVEMMWRGEWNAINSAILKPGISWICRCAKCGCPQDYRHNFCPNCGAPMTDEAVEMVMERLEKLHENNG